MGIDEEVVLARATAGDDAAMAFLLHRFDQPLLSHIRRRMPARLNSTAAPEDVAQEVRLHACRLIRSFESQGPGSFLRWLQVIANNRILGLLRQFRTRRTYAASSDDYAIEALQQLASHRRTPSGSAAAHEFVQTVESSINRLADDHRRVLTLRFLAGQSVQEVAASMSRTDEAVRMLCSRALKQLRLELVSASRWH